MDRIDFQTHPDRYRHWRIEIDGRVATLVMDVAPDGGLFDGYELKLNTYDLGVDIELNDAVQRLRFEHPEVGVVVLASGKEGVFCAGANIRMLAQAGHGRKVNFCKFTNETRLAIEDASCHSGQVWIAAVKGSAAGGGYELALAAEEILLVDDRRASVALPETALLAVLPGTGGLTRLTDKRRIRRDLADAFCSREEGVRGRKAVEWRLVDDVIPPSAWDAAVRRRATERAALSDRPASGEGVRLGPLDRVFQDDAVVYRHVRVTLDRARRVASILVQGPSQMPPADAEAARQEGDRFWPLAMARDLEDAILHLRANEPSLGVIVFRTEGDPEAVLAYDTLLEAARDDWFIREVRLYLKRVFKRIDVTSRSLVALVEPGSCFAGTLAELLFAADRSAMFLGVRSDHGHPPAFLTLSSLNFSTFPMGNGLSRLEARFWGEPENLKLCKEVLGHPLAGAEAVARGLVTAGYDEFDWNDEIRILLEERTSFSPDALTGMEANLRFVGPETMESKIFGRLTAWQNWIFQRPNAVGEAGALKRYGSGVQPDYDRERV